MVDPLDGLPVQPFCILEFPGRHRKLRHVRGELKLFKKEAVRSSLMCHLLLEQSNTATCVRRRDVQEDERSPGRSSLSLSYQRLLLPF